MRAIKEMLKHREGSAGFGWGVFWGALLGWGIAVLTVYALAKQGFEASNTMALELGADVPSPLLIRTLLHRGGLERGVDLLDKQAVERDTADTFQFKQTWKAVARDIAGVAARDLGVRSAVERSSVVRGCVSRFDAANHRVAVLWRPLGLTGALPDEDPAWSAAAKKLSETGGGWRESLHKSNYGAASTDLAWCLLRNYSDTQPGDGRVLEMHWSKPMQTVYLPMSFDWLLRLAPMGDTPVAGALSAK